MQKLVKVIHFIIKNFDEEPYVVRVVCVVLEQLYVCKDK
jgi:hypothetical protein